MSNKYKILSFDGGGTWAVIQLLTLKEKYGGDKTGHQILRDYDLVIANSGGSLVLTALCANWSLDKAIHFLDQQSNREKIFSRLSFWERYFPTTLLKPLKIGPRYSTRRKLEALRGFFPELIGVPIKDLPTKIGNKDLRIIVSTYDAIYNRAKFFKSHKGESASLKTIDLILAVHASTNAPVNYFDFPANFDVEDEDETIDFYAWDGALGGFNNPVAAGLIEVITNKENQKPISMVSLGTYNKTISSKERKNYIDLYGKLIKNSKLKVSRGSKFFQKTTMSLAKSILYEPPDWANYVAYVLRFGSDNNYEENVKDFVRLSPMIHMNKNTSEDVKNDITKLSELDMDIVQETDYKLIKKCFEYWKNGELINQPIRASIDNKGEMECRIGHPTFADGLIAWKRLFSEND